MATSSPHASIPGCNRAIRDTWRANLAAKGSFSRRGTRNHAWREDVASAARPFRGSGMRHAAWPNGLCALRQRHAARGMAERALRPAARAWPVCRLRPSLPSRLCPPRPAPPAISPAFIAAVLYAPLRRPHRVHRAQPSAAPPIAVGVSRLSVSSRRPRAAHADASRPPMRARRHRPAPTRANRAPALSQPSPAHPWSRLRPSAPRHPLHLALPRGSRCGSGNSREMVR